MSDLLVSVLIPCYNSENYIAATIKSVINQTYNNIEIIVVDDGSKDNTLEVARSFQSKDIKVIAQKNSGACKTRNHAFRYANGDLIQYLDADDILEENKIKSQIDLYLQSDNKHVILNCQWIHFHNSTTNLTRVPQLIDKSYDDPIKWLVDSWNGGGMSQTACWLTPKELILKAGPWNENLPNNPNDDGEFFCRVLLQAHRIIFDTNSVVYYRVPGSLNVSRNFTKTASASLLGSYKSYAYETLKICQDRDLKRALASNYLNFMYQFYGKFNDLCNEAEEAFKDLGFKKMWPVGGEKFKIIAKYIGFKNTLKIKHLL